MAFVDEIQVDHYPTKHYKTSFSLNRGGTFGAVCKYGVERKVTHHSTLGATMAFGLPIGVTLTIKVTRGQQTYLFPLHLADEVGITTTVHSTHMYLHMIPDYLQGAREGHVVVWPGEKLLLTWC